MKYIFVLTFLFKTCFSWGPQGHEIVASYAQSINSPIVIQKYTTILNGQTLSNISNWADEIREELPWSSQLHYIDTPDNLCNYNHKRDCGDENCVAGAISNYTQRLTSNIEPEISLKFVVHFIGDIHQPLHVGFTTDRGGNTIKVLFFSKHYNLHAVWDSAIIERRLEEFNNNITNYTNYLLKNSNEKLGSINIDDWGEESILYACEYAYEYVHNSSHLNLGQEYYSRSLPIVEKRLVQAGIRLANTLENILI
jgi:hypothetical protein